jgi:hypothetical protein
MESHALASDEKNQIVWKPNMQVALSRHQQESHQAMVRHEDLRQPHEGAKISLATEITRERGLEINGSQRMPFEHRAPKSSFDKRIAVAN